MTTPVLDADQTDTLEQTAQLLIKGKIVILPTETVYGIGALASNGKAIARIYSGKTRPQSKALIAHVDGQQMADTLGELNDLAASLIKQFWPGPLTLIVTRKANANIHPLASGGLSTIAIRCPDHHFTRNLITRLGQTLVAPSANITDQQPPTSVNALSPQIASRVDLIVDGGTCSNGQPSTLIDLTSQPPKLLRQGTISRKEIEAVSGPLG